MGRNEDIARALAFHWLYYQPAGKTLDELVESPEYAALSDLVLTMLNEHYPEGRGG